jgi:hypothetical protein
VYFLYCRTVIFELLFCEKTTKSCVTHINVRHSLIQVDFSERLKMLSNYPRLDISVEQMMMSRSIQNL